MNIKKQQFLLNKQNFINLLSGRLTKAGMTTLHAQGDADFLIVKTAVEMSNSCDTVVLGGDTDLLVPLCYHVSDTAHKVYFQNEGKNSKCIDISTVRASLGQDVCDNLLFLHSILECDTVSKPSGLGKPLAIRIYRKNERFRLCAREFTKIPDTITKEGIIVAC